MQRFLSELRRRRVFRVAAAYAVAGFVVLQAADLAVEPLRLPDWTMTLLWVLALTGFPIAAVLAWAFEITPEGVRKTESASPLSAGRLATRGTLAIGLGATMLVALGLAGWHFAGPGRGAVPPPGGAPVADGGALESEPEADEPVYRALLARRGASSVAVLPFANLSPDTANAYFTAGIHDAVITALANVGELTVTSRTSVLPYADSKKDVRTIAGELGVTHIVEGTVQRAGGRVRATVQLIDARTDRHVWAEHLEREITPEAIFAIQSGIAEQVAQALEASLSPRERDQIERRPTENVEAWELYTRARHVARTRTSDYSPAAIARVFATLRRAVALDPGFALAHAELARLYAVQWDGTQEDQWGDSVQAAVKRALEIEPALPEAHLALASYYGATRDLEAERRATLRALELRPNYLEAISRLSRNEADLARLDRSLCLARRAVEVEPTEVRGWIRLGAAYRDLGFFARAEEAFRAALDREGAGDWPYPYLVEVALAQGARDKALEYYRALRARGDSTARALQIIAVVQWDLGWPDSASVHFRRAEEMGSGDRFDLHRAAALWELGDQHGARKVLSGFEAEMQSRLGSGTQDYSAYLYLMSIHAMRGETEAAVDALEKAVERRFRILPWIESRPGSFLGRLPGMDRLENDDQYRAVVARLSAAQDSMRQIVERNGC